MQADIRHAVNWKWALFPLAMLLAVGALLASGRPFSPVAEHSEHAQPARTAFGSGARWIWNATDTPDQWVAFRRTFILRAAPSSALTHISVDTHYWLYVNGNLVIFEGGLKRGPNRTDTYYDQKDIASHLSSGPNTIAILAWHFGRNGGAAASHTHVDSGSGALLFRSDILVNGVTTTINSDINWKQTIFPGYVHDTSAPMPYILPEWNIHYDARNAGSMTNWTTSGYDDSAWFPPVEKGGPGAAPWNALVLRPIPLYRFTGLRSYANNSSLPTSGNGSNITAKLPSNVQVTPYLRVNAPAGLTITIQTDHYNDGGQTNVRSTYITTSGEQEFESLGWMSGTAVIYNIPTGVTVLDLKYRESGYDTAFAGSFTSNDPFFNSLWTKAVRTMYVNMRDNYSDCPTRERALWWGDAAVAVRGSVYAFDRRVNLLANKGIKQLVGWKRPNGVLFSPIPGDSRELPPQMLATIAEMWDFYLQTGDSSALDGATYTAVKTYMNLWTFDSHGLVNHRPGDWDWYDWGSNIDARVLDNAWYYMALDSTINLAKLTGNGQDVAGWQSKKNSIAANFNDALWNNTNHEYRSPGYTGGTDDRANAMAVVSGLASAANYSHITNVLRTHQNPSPYMETFVIEALYRMNAATDAQNRLASRYKAMVDDPAYTLWEVWEKGAGTDDHGWNGAPLMLSRYGIGARATSPGWTTYELLPQRGKLTTMNGVIPTVKGTLSVSLNASNTTSYTLGITSPNGTTGRVGVPTLATNITITANGTTVFQNGAATGSVSGLSYQGNDANYVYFNVNPGIWNFAATGGLVTASPAPALAPGWNYCAGEGGTCVFSDTTQVRYGSGTTFNTLTLTGGTPCTNAVFGDTTPGVVKHCDLYVSAVGVISYQDINYSGTASDANGPRDYATLPSDDWMWALAVPAGWSVDTYADSNFGGTVCMFTGRYLSWVGLACHDMVSSFRSRTTTGSTAAPTRTDTPAAAANISTRANTQTGPTPTPTRINTPAPSGWTLCANENGTCSFSGTMVVRYGANTSYAYVVTTDSIVCNNSAFGDPVPYTVKHCDYSRQPPSNGWTLCASETGSCSFSGSMGVAYGAHGAFFYLQATSSIACNNATFGDPIFGAAKSCYYK